MRESNLLERTKSYQPPQSIERPATQISKTPHPSRGFIDHGKRAAYTQIRVGYSNWIFHGKPRRGDDSLDSTELARMVVDVASEKLAEDIVMLDLRQVASFADYFIIMSADSGRQIEALEEDITKDLKQANVNRFHREGTPNSGWVLLDFSDVVIHIFSPEEREFYNLERLWSQAPQVVRIL